MKRIAIIGASSGLGYGVAEQMAQMGWRVGIAARRQEPLEQLRRQYPDNIVAHKAIDVTQSDAPEKLNALIDEMGGVDTVFLVSGVGKQNPTLEIANDITTAQTNVVGFIHIVNAAYDYFRREGKSGHIAVVSSIAGTKGLGIAASYSATKRFQNTYIDAVEQLSRMQGADIKFTDVRPGFVATPLLNSDKKFPMLMTTDYAVRRIVKAVVKQKRVAVIDWRWRMLVGLWRLIPAWMWKRLPVKNG